MSEPEELGVSMRWTAGSDPRIFARSAEGPLVYMGGAVESLLR